MDKSTKRLTVTPAPHLRDALDVRTFGLDVLTALLPAAAVAVFTYGTRALAVMAAGMAGSLTALVLYSLTRHRLPGTGAGCTLAAGLLLAMLCPAGIALWIPFLGAAVGSFFGTLVMGGIGFGPWHPTLVGGTLLMTAFPTAMTRWSQPRISSVCQTSMGALRDPNLLEILQKNATIYRFEALQHLLGQSSGALGTTAVLALLAGGVYLAVRGLIRWRVPVTYLLNIALWAMLFPQGDTAPLISAFVHAAGSMSMLCAIFLAAMPGVAPVTAGGQLLYGVCCGLLTMAMRYFGGRMDGSLYAVLCMSLCARLFDGLAHLWMHPRGRRWKPGQHETEPETADPAGEEAMPEEMPEAMPEEIAAAEETDESEELPRDESLPLEEIILSGEPGVPLPEEQLMAVHPAATAEDIATMHPVPLSVEALKTLVVEQATGSLRVEMPEAPQNAPAEQPEAKQEDRM